jgi:hypothetical protein
VRKWFLLALCAGLAVAALLVWFAAEGARQAALLRSQMRQAMGRVIETDDRLYGAIRRQRPMGQEEEEAVEAEREYQALVQEQRRRQQSWPVRLLREVRRRAGW